MNIALDRPNPHAHPVSVIVGDFTTRPVPGSNPPRTYGTATPGEDYVAFQPFRLYWAPGQRVASFPIALLGDTLDEAAEEEIDVRFSGPDGIRIADNDIDVYLRDNDPLGTTLPGALPVPKLTNSRALEGDAGCARTGTRSTSRGPTERSRDLGRRLRLHDACRCPAQSARNYGDATPGVDYVAFAPFRLSFPPSATAPRSRSRCAGHHGRGRRAHQRADRGPGRVDFADNDMSIYLRNDD